MSKEIKFNIKLNVDGKEQLATATTSVKEMSDAVKMCRRNARGLNDALIDFNQKVEAFGNAAETFSQISSAISRYGQSISQTAQLTGLTGDGLRELRNEAQAFSTTFGTDFGETIQAVNALAKGFGITAGEAMRLVQDGMVSGANATGQFLDILREYPRYFSEAGISAEAFVAITTNAARQGVFSDKGVDAIKEANIRLRELTPATQAALEGIGMSSEAVQQALRDGSATTFQIMQQVAARLATLPASSAEVGAAIADIFGGPGEDAGLEYIKTLATVETSMDALKAGADDYSKSLDRQAGFMAAVKNRLTSVIDLTEVFNTIAPGLNVASQVGMSVVSIAAMTKSLQALNATAAAGRVASFARQIVAATRNFVLYGTAARSATAASAAMAASCRGTAAAATTAAMALRAMMVATGVGIAVAALSAIVGRLTGAFADAGDAAEEAGRKMQSVADAEGEYVRVAAETQVAIDGEAKKLKGLMDAKADTTAAVARLNEAYGDSFGTYETAAKWYDVLIRKSKEYAMAKGYEAQSEAASTRISEINFKLQNNYAARRKLWAEGKAVQDEYRYLQNGAVGVRDKTGRKIATQEYSALKSEGATLIAERNELEAAVNFASKEIEKLAVSMKPLVTTDTGNGKGKGDKDKGGTTVPSAPAPAEGSMAHYERLISDARQRMERTADPAEARAALEDMQDASYGLHELKLRIGIEKPAEAVPIAKSINEELQAEIEPIDIQVRTNDLDKARERMGAATDAVARLGGSLASIGREIEVPALDVAGTIAAAIATTIMGFAEASAKEGKLGIWGWIAASVAGLANLTAVVGSIKAMGAFADGGVVSGPTLALVGEYAGAGSNPEVIAPLDKLRAMLNPAPGAVAGAVRFEIDGRKLVGVLSNETRTAAKSGRRSGIVI